MSQRQVYEQIQDDEQEYQQKQQQKYQEQQQTGHYITQEQIFNSHEHQGYDARQQENIENQYIGDYQKQEQSPTHKSPKKSEDYINNQELGKYAFYEDDLQDGHNISISITKMQKRGGIMSAYYVYFIDGADEKGSFSVARRFNQYFEMRAAMVSRWPGCFIPSIPAKNMLLKNDMYLVQRRKRYLNQFVKKMAKLPHLYYGQEFQALLRTQQSDISELFKKWATPTTQSIINKYRINFSQLAGKQLNFDTNEKINNFVSFIKKSQSKLQKDRESMKRLAESNDKLIIEYSSFFSILPQYEKICLKQYCNGNENDLLYLNESQIKLQEHEALSKQSFKSNKYWLLYDMIRHQERDGLAFLQAFEAKGKYQNKRNTLEIKINQNQKSIHQFSMGKKSMISKGSSDQLRYKIQVENQQLKRQKDSVLIMIDIITALIAYIEIQRYKTEKITFYKKALGKIGSNQIFSVQTLGEIWSGLRDSTQIKIK